MKRLLDQDLSSSRVADRVGMSTASASSASALPFSLCFIQLPRSLSLQVRFLPSAILPHCVPLKPVDAHTSSCCRLRFLSKATPTPKVSTSSVVLRSDRHHGLATPRLSLRWWDFSSLQSSQSSAPTILCSLPRQVVLIYRSTPTSQAGWAAPDCILTTSTPVSGSSPQSATQYHQPQAGQATTDKSDRR